jgi:TorA maturation chaperone TorD
MITGQSAAEQAQEMNAEAARTLSLGWGTLALAFDEPTELWVEGLLSGSMTRALSEATKWLGSDRERFTDPLEMLREFVTDQQRRHPQDLLRELKKEYYRLFIGPSGRMRVPPCESAYRDRDIAGAAMAGEPSTLAVEEFYRRHGMQSALSHWDSPDHIATELEFKSLLAWWEREAWKRGEVTVAGRLRRAEQQFLVEHIGQWVPEFCGQLQNAAQGDLHRALAGILWHFLAVEARAACEQCQQSRGKQPGHGICAICEELDRLRRELSCTRESSYRSMAPN